MKITTKEMHDYGYTWDGMEPIDFIEALNLFDSGDPVYALHEDNTESMIEYECDIWNHIGMFGVEK